MKVQVDVARLFPITARYRYFNSAAVAPLSTRARNAMRRLSNDQLQHGAVHDDRWWDTYETCRGRAANLIGASADEIALVANTSAGITTVARGLRARPGDNVVIPDAEFPANVYPWLALRGVEVRQVKKRAGKLLADDIAARVDDRTVAISVSFVDWLSGQRVDLAAIGAVTRSCGALFCVDAIQGLGAFPVDVSACGIDALAADGHKWLCAPEGAGILYVSRHARERIAPTRPSWLSVRHPTDFLTYDLAPAASARRYQDGTPNTGGIYGLNAALELIEEVGLATISERILERTAQLRAGATARGIELGCDPDPGEESGIVSLRLDDAENVATALAGRKIIVAARGGMLRVACHYFNSKEEVDQLLDLFQ